MITVASSQKQATRKELMLLKIKLKDVNKFKTLLMISGYSQRAYARAIGISEPYANQIANGTRNPGPEIAKNTADLLGVKFEDIFFIDYACKSEQSEGQAI